jgi:oligopeptide transport system permease protein
MICFLLSRLLQGVIVIFMVITITFFLSKMIPGGLIQNEKNVSPVTLKAQAEYYGWDKPLIVQWWKQIVHYATFDMPESTHFRGRYIDEIIASGFPVSASVAVLALSIALSIGIPVGAISALKPHTLEDRVSMLATTTGICMPTMVSGPIIALVLGLHLRWFNASGWQESGDVVLPAVTLGIIYSAYIARLMRGSLRETLALEFIRTARAKGAGEIAVVFRHAMKLACLPVLNFLGPAAAGLLTGSFVVETTFQLPGLGQFFIAAVKNNDHQLTMGLSVLFAALIVFFNLLVDLLQAWLNPRIRLQA